MQEFWDARYRKPEYVYGTTPNVFFQQQLDLISPPAKLLLPAEGEGRNGVYAARQGWEVHAFDLSPEGKTKAEQLAHQQGVSLTYQVGEFQSMTFQAESFDAIGLIYAHFPADRKSFYHQTLKRYLRTGGWVIFEAFSKSQLQYSQKNPKSGGPRNLDMLFSVEELQQDFGDFDIHLLKEEVVSLQEGQFHIGEASVIRFVGQKQ